MRDWLIIAGFVLMLMAPCVAALVVTRIGRRQKEALAAEEQAALAGADLGTDARPVALAKAVEKPLTSAITAPAKAVANAEFAVMRNLSSGEIQTVRVVWSKQFESSEYPRAGGRIRKRI